MSSCITWERPPFAEDALAGDERRVVTGEKRGQAGYVGRRPKTTNQVNILRVIRL